MRELTNMDDNFFAIAWIIVFVIIIIASIWLVKDKKRKTNRKLAALKREHDNGEISGHEYEKRRKKILED